jgi:Tol biopolymer transport system component
LSYLDCSTGRQVDFFRSDTQHLNHSICTHDGRYVITDNDKKGDNELILVEVETGRSEVLWWPNVQFAHPKMSCSGPCISPQQTWIGRTSDRSGEPQVYLIRLPR